MLFPDHFPLHALQRQSPMDHDRTSTENTSGHGLPHEHEEHTIRRALIPTSEARAPHTMPRSRRRRKSRPPIALLSVIAAAVIIPTIVAQQACIPLTGSTACPAFTSSSVSTDPYIVGLFPFLANVNDLTSFDNGIQTFATQGWVADHYIRLFGCSGIDLSNTTAVYARYTISFLCNAIIQNSIRTCGLSTAESRPMCADSCAEFALSEQVIMSTPAICGNDPSSNAISQLRADFTNCALPANAITGSCIPAYVNEASNCGFQNNIEGLCTFCSGSTINSTDSCCVESNVETRCQGVRLPAFTSLTPLFTTTVSGPASTVTAASTNIPANTTRSHGLSGGQIAGIVAGSVLGGLLILGLLICVGLLLRRQKKRPDEKDMNYRRSPPMPPAPMPISRQPMAETYSGLRQQPSRPPGMGRVVGMTAHERPSADSPLTGTTPSTNAHSSPESLIYGSGSSHPAFAAAIPLRRDRSPQRYDGHSPTPILGARSLHNDNTTSSPEGSQDSDQIDSFKDYYSADEIYTGDIVSVLWAYQPRAEDEWELERGDMLRIVGIWDDGWATAERVSTRAEDWEDGGGSGGATPRQRDSVVGGIGDGGDVRAFPLVCVCLPQHWRRTIEGDSSAEEPPTSEDDGRTSRSQGQSVASRSFAQTPARDLNDENDRRGGASLGVHPAMRSELPGSFKFDEGRP